MSYYKIKMGVSGPSASAKEIWAGFIASSPEQAMERVNAGCLGRGLVVHSGSLTEISYKEYQQILDERKHTLLALEHLLYSSLN